MPKVNNLIYGMQSSCSTFSLSESSNLWIMNFVLSFRQQAKVFQEKMAELLGGASGSDSNDVAIDLMKMTEAAGKVLEGQPLDPEFTDSINEVLKSLNEGQEAAQNPFAFEQLSGLFQGMDVNGAEGSESFMPIMQNMMQSLLSAEVLLPSLKELVEKYPGWLSENSAKLSAEDNEKYNKQLVLMKEVVAELELEKKTDSTDTKNARFTKVLEKLQKMQDLGQPPAELVAPGEGALNADAGDCNIM